MAPRLPLRNRACLAHRENPAPWGSASTAVLPTEVSKGEATTSPLSCAAPRIVSLRVTSLRFSIPLYGSRIGGRPYSTTELLAPLWTR